MKKVHKLFKIERIKEVEKELEKFDSCFEEADFVYRSYHRSFKIIHIPFYALWNLNACLYIIGKTAKLSRNWDELVKFIRPHIQKETLTQKIFNECVENNFMVQQDREAKKKGLETCLRSKGTGWNCRLRCMPFWCGLRLPRPP